MNTPMFNKPCRITTGEQTAHWSPDLNLSLSEAVSDCLTQVRKLGVPVVEGDQFLLLPVTVDVTHVMLNGKKVAEILDVQNLRPEGTTFSKS